MMGVVATVDEARDVAPLVDCRVDMAGVADMAVVAVESHCNQSVDSLIRKPD